MRNVILGFIVGVALAGLAGVLLGEAPEDTYAELQPSAAPRQSTGTRQIIVESSPSDATIVSANADPETGASRNAVQGAILTLEELEQRAKEARNASDLAQRELLRAQRVARWAAEPPPARPIVLPPEFAYLWDDPDDNHERIQREAIDPVWSATTETQIQNYLVGRQDFVNKYGYPTVECRTTRCEIAIVSYGVGAAEDFRNFHAEFFDQDWTDQFKVDGLPGLINSRVRNEGNVTTILWHLIQPSEQLRRPTGQTDGAR